MKTNSVIYHYLICTVLSKHHKKYSYFNQKVLKKIKKNHIQLKYIYYILKDNKNEIFTKNIVKCIKSEL